MRFPSLILVLLVAVALTSCDESINPILETDRQYTLFGTLDMATDTQFVRVIAIRPTLTAPDQKLDIIFTSQQAGSDIIHTWTDSIHTFEDGSAGHIFYAPFRVHAGKYYNIAVHKPGSELATTAFTQVPNHLEPSVQQEKLTWVQTTTLVATQRILWWSLDEDPYDIVQWYRFFIFDDYGFVDIRINHQPASKASDTHEGFWETRLDLVRDRDSLLANHPEMFTRGFLAGLGMTLTVLDKDWTPPGGVFTAEALGQPGTLSNVVNGFGYIGAVGRFSAEWLIQDTSAITLGYRVLDSEAFPDVAAQVWNAPVGSLEQVRE